MNYIYSGNNNYEYSQQLSQTMLDKQKQSLKYSYETLGNLLSAAENFAGLSNQQYRSYNYSNAKDHNSLKSEFAWELNCFNTAIQLYQKKYGPYKFPKDCPKERILKDIQIYKQRMNNEEDRMLYQMMFDIINGKSVNTDFSGLYQKLDKNSNHHFDPRKMKNIIGPLNQILDHTENDANNGNMDLFSKNQAYENAKNKLKNLQEEPSQKMQVIIGEKGNIILYNQNFYFLSENNDSKKLIKNFVQSDLTPDTYISINKNNIIYISEIISNNITCVLFNKDKKKTVSENEISLKREFCLDDESYVHGNYVDSKGEIIPILYHIDMK